VIGLQQHLTVFNVNDCCASSGLIKAPQRLTAVGHSLLVSVQFVHKASLFKQCAGARNIALFRAAEIRRSLFPAWYKAAIYRQTIASNTSFHYASDAAPRKAEYAADPNTGENNGPNGHIIPFGLRKAKPVNLQAGPGPGRLIRYPGLFYKNAASGS